MASQVQVQFSASVKDLIDATDRVKGAIEGVKATAESAMAGLRGLGEAVGVAFSIEKIVEFVGQMAELGEHTERMSAILGVSTRGVQELGFIAKATGGDSESLALAMERLQVNLQKAQTGTGPAAAALQALGLRARDLIGLPLEEQMGRIADAMAKFADGGNKTAIAMELLGRGGAQMIPVLDQGRAGIEAYTKAADESGTVMSRQTITALAGVERGLVTMRGAATGLGGTLVGEFSGAINSATRAMTDFLSGVNALVQADKLWDFATEEIVGQLRLLVDELLVLGVVAKDVFTLDWGAISSDWKAGLERAQNDLRGHQKKLADIMAGARADMAAGLAGTEASGKPQAPASDVSGGKGKSTVFNDQIKAADAAFKALQQHLDAEVKLHNLTQTQETQQLLAALDQRYAAETAALTKEEALYAAGSDQQRHVLDQELAAYQKYITDRQKLTDKQAQDEQKAWQSITGPIMSAWNSQLKGILAGTETFGTAMKNIFSELSIKLIEYMEDVFVKEVVIKALMTAVGMPPIPGFAAGAWEIPATMPAILHSGEMVLPSGPAGALRSALEGDGGSGAGGGGANINLSVSAMDAAGVQRFFQQYGRQIAQTLALHLNAPSMA